MALRHRVSNWRSVLLVPAVLLIGCQPEPATHSRELFVFGTVVELTVCSGDAADARVLLDEAQADMQRIHRRWHAWEPGGLARINQAFAAGGSVEIEADTRRLLIEIAGLERESRGFFNPAIGKLVAAWGFHTSDYPVTTPPPDDEVIADLVAAAPSMADLTIEASSVSSRNPDVALDFGAVGKGAVVDRVIGRFREKEVACAMVNAGGDLRGYGVKSDGSHWRVAIRDPARADGRPVGVVELIGDESIFTSGNYLRFRADERQYGHILNPHTGRPVERVVSATVIAQAGTRADAAATALIVAGAAEWRAIASAMGVRAALLVYADGSMEMYGEMRERLKER